MTDIDAAEIKRMLTDELEREATALISRAEAIQRGETRYFTGEPCRRGHIAHRKVSSCNCVACIREDYRRDIDKHRAAYRARYANNPKMAERIKKQAAAWQKANPQKFKAIMRASFVKHRAKRRARLKEWRANNKDKVAAQSRRTYERHKDAKIARARARRAMKMGAGGTHTRADIENILKAQRHRCAYCRADLRKVDCHVDHIVPLSRGGSNDRRNIQVLCQPCNNRKYAHDPIDFARSLGRLM